MKHFKFLLSFLLLVILAHNASSQTTIINVWPDGIPGSLRSETYFEESTVTGDIVSLYEKVTDPTLTVFLPPAEKATGTAVLICPGGDTGYLHLIMKDLLSPGG